MIIHGIVTVFAVFLIYVAQPGSSLFSWHPTLMVIAYSVLMFEGILHLSSTKSLLWLASRTTKVSYHWIFQAFALFFMTCGLVIIVVNKHYHNKPHFTTWHGLLGLVTFIIFNVQSLGGFFVKNYQFAPPTVSLASLKYYHALSGLSLTILASFTVLLGLNSAWFSGVVIGAVQMGTFLFPVAVVASVGIQIAQHYFSSFWGSNK